MADSTQLLRQWKMLQSLSRHRHGLSLKDLAHDFEASERTILRDLNLLKRVGFPLLNDTARHGKNLWRINRDDNWANIHLNFEEATALALGQQFFEGLAGTPFWKNADEAFKKIKSTLSETALNHLRKIAGTLYIKHGTLVDYTPRAQLIDDINVAIEDRLMSNMTYQSLRTTEPVTIYDVYPYALVFHKSALYLIAYSKDHDAIRTFKVDRISEFRHLQLKFPQPVDFDPEKHLEYSFGIFSSKDDPQLIRIRFTAKVKRLLEEKVYHTSQKLIPQKDGSVIVEYTLTTLEEIRSWILSYGHHAQVLEPIELIDAVKKEVDLMSKIYGKAKLHG
jgi:proteasome accessory factor B